MSSRKKRNPLIESIKGLLTTFVVTILLFSIVFIPMGIYNGKLEWEIWLIFSLIVSLGVSFLVGKDKLF
ncbi:hypothetical protein [Psychroserpens sp. S379A]|uniref:hypothetical protein n=1 Tax=Psychroserpens sp. S379A TaxID=3415137 RepID=UPI003C7BB694